MRTPSSPALPIGGVVKRCIEERLPHLLERDQDDIEQSFVGIRIRDKDVSQGSFIFDVH